MERICAGTDKPDVILDEDLDHFYLNGVKVAANDNGLEQNRVAFWNCNGWGGEMNGGKERILAEMAAHEGVDMICVTDTRLDNYMGLRVVGKICSELKKHTGKTWTGKDISRREDRRTGGAVILHTMDWTGVKIKEKIKYGVCVEIKGKWAGKKHTILSVYRPCMSNNDGSLRVTLELELKGKLEEVLWGVIKNPGGPFCFFWIQTA